MENVRILEDRMKCREDIVNWVVDELVPVSEGCNVKQSRPFVLVLFTVMPSAIDPNLMPLLSKSRCNF